VPVGLKQQEYEKDKATLPKDMPQGYTVDLVKIRYVEILRRKAAVADRLPHSAPILESC